MLPTFPWDRLPERSIPYADKAYTQYAFEDLLQITERTFLFKLFIRRKNPKRSLSPYLRLRQHKVRETGGNDQ